MATLVSCKGLILLDRIFERNRHGTLFVPVTYLYKVKCNYNESFVVVPKGRRRRELLPYYCMLQYTYVSVRIQITQLSRNNVRDMHFIKECIIQMLRDFEEDM